MQRRGRWKWYSLLPVLAATAMAVGALAIFEARAAPRAETASEPVAKTEVPVTFDPNPVKTGYEKNLNGTFKSSLLRHVIATVNPASARDSIKFNKADATERVEIRNIKKLGNDKWEFDVAGKLRTPVAYPKGDTTIQAKKNGKGKVLGSVKVIVQVPDKIGKPHDQKQGQVTPINVGVNVGSSPVDTTTPANQSRLVTCYGHSLTVTVVDQFGEHLEAAYENKSVFENVGGWVDINQKLTANGTYTDPVGVSMSLTAGGLMPVRVDKNGPDELAWMMGLEFFVNGETIPAGVHVGLNTQNFPPDNVSVRIVGHVLSEGVVNRQIQATAPNTIKIVWPD